MALLWDVGPRRTPLCSFLVHCSWTALCIFREQCSLPNSSVHFWREVLDGVSAGCEVSVGKGGCHLCALQGSSKQGRKLDGCRNKVHSSGKLDEARLLKENG